ncbi:MAG: hypothetical protein AABZ47_01560 [Planctomycetota bacterium]
MEKEPSQIENQSNATPDFNLPNYEPMTLSLMGKLFGVPLIIIGSILAGAIVVVMLFGGPAAPEKQSLDQLLQVLEGSSGEKSLGVLLPREKELWQTALELAERLQKKEVEVTEEELKLLTSRLIAMVRKDTETVENVPTTGAERENQTRLRSGRLEFLIHALGRTEQPEAIEELIHLVRQGREPYVGAAMKQLGDLGANVQARTAVGPILSVLKNSQRIETRLVACTVISVLTEKGNIEAAEALNAARLGSEGELVWSASLALARLGSNAGKVTLLDMLDRGFWSSASRYEVREQNGTVRRFVMPPARVDQLLMATIDAVAFLEDSDLWESIERLKSDTSLAVRARAKAAVEGRVVPRGSAG